MSRNKKLEKVKHTRDVSKISEKKVSKVVKRTRNGSKSSSRDCDNFDEASRGCIPITPQMIRSAITKLQTRRVYVDTKLISEYLLSIYPIEKHPETHEKELAEKLECAVIVGLIIKHDDKYDLPTFRQEANSIKSRFAAFWETYKKKYCVRNPRQTNIVDKRLPRKGISEENTNLFDNDNDTLSDESF